YLFFNSPKYTDKPSNQKNIITFVLKFINVQITFLGTGSSQGIPIIGCKDPVCLSDNPKDKRLRSSVMVQWNNSRYIVDTGPDFRQQMLYHCVDRIDGVFFTHEHSDHVLGFD